MKKYEHQELTIIWKPELCKHAGVCVRALPNVYKPKDKPWINPEGANANDLRDQIRRCPSGALSYIDK